MAALASALLKKIRQQIDAKNQPGVEGQQFWAAASEALTIVEKRADLLDTWSETELIEFLATWKADSNRGVQLAAIAAADARGLIDALHFSTEALEADTEMRAERREELLAMAKELGFIGAKVLMVLALAALA